MIRSATKAQPVWTARAPGRNRDGRRWWGQTPSTADSTDWMVKRSATHRAMSSHQRRVSNGPRGSQSNEMEEKSGTLGFILLGAAMWHESRRPAFGRTKPPLDKYTRPLASRADGARAPVTCRPYPVVSSRARKHRVKKFSMAMAVSVRTVSSSVHEISPRRPSHELGHPVEINRVDVAPVPNSLRQRTWNDGACCRRSCSSVSVDH